MSITKYCPGCSGQIVIADKYDNSAPRIYGKNCMCSPDTGRAWPEDCQSMHQRINDLEKWVTLLVESIPQSTTPQEGEYIPDSLYMDLNPSTRFSECVKSEVIDRAKESGIHPQPGKIVWLKLCMYCGDISTYSVAVKANPDDPDMDVGNHARCYRCQEVLDKHPRLYEWITRIIQWRFRVDAWTPKKTSFEQVRVDPPPPPPKMPSKNIIV